MPILVEVMKSKWCIDEFIRSNSVVNTCTWCVKDFVLFLVQ